MGNSAYNLMDSNISGNLRRLLRETHNVNRDTLLVF